MDSEWVDLFYEKIRVDKSLSPSFIASILDLFCLVMKPGSLHSLVTLDLPQLKKWANKGILLWNTPVSFYLHSMCNYIYLLYVVFLLSGIDIVLYSALE